MNDRGSAAWIAVLAVFCIVAGALAGGWGWTRHKANARMEKAMSAYCGWGAPMKPSDDDLLALYGDLSPFWSHAGYLRELAQRSPYVHFDEDSACLYLLHSDFFAKRDFGDEDEFKDQTMIDIAEVTPRGQVRHVLSMVPDAKVGLGFSALAPPPKLSGVLRSLMEGAGTP